MSFKPSVADLRQSLGDVTVSTTTEKHNAAVALIVREDPHALQLCFIVRAEREGDRWSGQVAFPGGQPQHGDQHLHRTAERETLEEIGVNLQAAERLGALPHVPIRPAGPVGGVLAPFVYYLDGPPPALTPEVSEVSTAFWADLDQFHEPARRTTIPWGSLRFPGIRLGEHVLWGLTLRVCEVWFNALGRPLDISWPIPP